MSSLALVDATEVEEIRLNAVGGDDSATVTGTDTMLFNGSAGNEIFATTAQGARFQFTRNLGNIVMNATEVEAITLNALRSDDR